MKSSRLKDQIIVQVLELIESNDKDKKRHVLKKLEKLANEYNISSIRKDPKSGTNTMKFLKEFILNDSGYPETIKKLYNSINNK